MRRALALNLATFVLILAAVIGGSVELQNELAHVNKLVAATNVKLAAGKAQRTRQITSLTHKTSNLASKASASCVDEHRLDLVLEEYVAASLSTKNVSASLPNLTPGQKRVLTDQAKASRRATAAFLARLRAADCELHP